MTGRLPLLAAPHRLLFLTGAVQLAVLLAWWAWVLLDLQGLAPMLPQTTPAVLVHAPALLFLVLPPYFFGFLLTTFPRWLGFPDSTAWVYAPVGLSFSGAALAVWSGLAGIVPGAIPASFVLAGAGWAWAIAAMLRLAVLERGTDRPVTWHAWSILAALAIGLGCLVLAGKGLFELDPLLVHIANLVALDLCIVPVFVTVCHRMIPFFAGNVVDDYARWRPFWVLWAFWASAVAATLGFALLLPTLAALGKLAGAAILALMLWKWWPRRSAPGLLWVLMIGFAWAPVAFALAAWTAVAEPALGRAPIHLVTIGFALSLVVAMVTRVTQGHSGQPLFMPAIAWIAFAAVQVATALRLAAAFAGEQPGLLVASAVILTAGILPWVVRSVWIYLRPRFDGKPG